VPDIAVAAVLVDAVHDGLDGVDLIGAHHHQLALVLDEHHVPADHLRHGALGEKFLSKVIKIGYFLVVRVGKLIDGQKPLVGIKFEVLGIVVGKIPSIGAIANHKKLHKA